MGATVIDSLLVTLGIDPKQFVKGADEANRSQKGIERQGARTAKILSDHEKQLAAERKTRAKEVDDQVRRMAAGYRSIRNELLGLFAVFTAGKALTGFFGDTIHEAAQLGFLSQNLRMSTEDLTAWQRAAERMGGSKEGAIAQLKQSAEDIAALRSGLGPSDSMQWFFRMGGSSSDLADGNKYLLARAKIVHDLFAVDPSRAALVASQMGISADQFDFIKQGPTAILALVTAQRKNSAITREDSAAALELRNRWLDFKASLEATTTKILVASIPAIEQFVGWLESLTRWVTDNKDAIGQWVADLVAKLIPVLKDIGHALSDVDWNSTKQGIKDVGAAIIEIADDLRSVIDLWNKWTGRNEKPTQGVTKVGGLRFGKTENLNADDARNGRPLPAPPPKQRTWADKLSDNIEMGLARTLASFGVKAAGEFVRDKTGKDDYNVGPAHNSIIDKLMRMGWTRQQAAGITASFDQESGLNPAARNAKSGAYGIGQWLAPRRADFKKWAGHDIVGSSLDEQLAFFQFEVTQGKERPAGDALRATKTAGDAARAHSTQYERPGAAEANNGHRAALGEALDAAVRARSAAEAAAKMPPVAALQAPASRPSSIQSDVKIGQLIIHTQATDAAGIARDLPGELQKSGFGFVTQANTGVA